MRPIFLLLLLSGAVALLTIPGCSNPTTTPADKGGEVLVLEYEEIDLIPGAEKQVKVKSGKAEKAEAPPDSGVTAKVEDGKVTIAAGKDAKEGDQEVKVKGGKKDATVKVHVKKKE